jgi:hypothetical protein
MADPPANSPQPPARRVADADREAVARRLRDAASEGRIDFQELEERLDDVYAAKNQTDLDVLTADLPAQAQSAQPLVLQTKSGSVKKRGFWRVPSAIEAECTSGVVKLDFTEAECPHAEVTVRVTAGSGAVVLIVPTDWSVDMDDASATSGSVVNKMRGRPAPGAPVLRVSGTVRSGTIKARPPRRSFRDWLRGLPV